MNFFLEIVTHYSYFLGMSMNLRFKERSADNYPSISMRILDAERQRKLQALKEAGVDISGTFRETTYELIDRAFEKLQGSK